LSFKLFILKIATLNIDWGKKQKSKSHIQKIETELLKLNSDILVITESVDSLHLPGYAFNYKTRPIPENTIYEGINYKEYLKGETAIRVAVFSKYESIRSFPVIDEYTSVCNEFNTEIGPITIYATIVGTRFNTMPYAKTELDNCISDCLRIASLTDNLCLVGDLNTSLREEEVYYEIKHLSSRKALMDLCEKCKMDLTTKNIDENIDHILLPMKINQTFKATPSVFVEKNVLSDHKGILVEINLINPIPDGKYK
jgi:endonuclease/exonuclease/phosphatase family metal-dependent hydrolase